MTSEMLIENAQYIQDPVTDIKTGVMATIDGKVIGVPLDPANRHYAEIMRQVEAGELTIADAE